MKKISAILNKNNVFNKLFINKERQINTAFDTIQNEIEEKVIEAEIRYDEVLKKFAETNDKPYDIIEELLKMKEIQLNGKAILDILKEIREDLNSEIPE